MSNFDPYYTWLGIPPAEQPPHHYRLLGVAKFEANADVISNAADQRMGHIRTYQSGAHGEASQRILNELAAARTILLLPERKAAYDAELRGADRPLLRAAPLPTSPEITSQIPAAAAPPPKPAAPTHTPAHAKAALPSWVAPIAVIGGVAMLLLVGAVVVLAGLFARSTETHVATAEPAMLIDVETSVPIKDVPAATVEQPTANVPPTPPPAPPIREIEEPSQEPSPPPPATTDTPKDPPPAELPDQLALNDDQDKEPPAEPQATPEDARLPVPAAALQEKQKKLLDEIFGAEIKAADTPEKQSQVAGRIFAITAGGKDAPEAQYMLLMRVCDMAISAGDSDTILKAIDRLDERFQVDGLRLKASAVFQSGRQSLALPQRQSLTVGILKLIDEAVVQERFDVAQPLCDVALDSARKTRQRDLIAQAVQRGKEVEALAKRSEEVAKFKQQLAENPDDAEAHLALGKYLAYDRGQWREGLAHLAKSSQPALAKAAAEDLAAPDKPPAQAALGDAWWDLMDAADASERDALKLRAGFWYLKAIGGLTGLPKAKVDKRLSEVKNLDARLAALDQADRENRPPPAGLPAVGEGPSDADAPPALPKGVLPGMIGRATVSGADAGALLQYVPGKKLSHDNTMKSLGVQGSAKVEVKLAGILPLDKPANVKIRHKGGSSSGGVLKLYVNGKELSAVGDDRSKDTTKDVPLPAGLHVIAWKLSGGSLGGHNLLVFTNADTGEPVQVVFTTEMLAQARTLPTRVEADLSE